MCTELSEFTDEDIAAQALTFFTDGYETSSTALSLLMYDLTCNPDVQQRLREEVDSVMEQYNGELNLDIIQEMKYLDMVVQGKII
jgi:cytochrome P450